MLATIHEAIELYLETLTEEELRVLLSKESARSSRSRCSSRNEVGAARHFDMSTLHVVPRNWTVPSEVTTQ